MYIYKYMLLYIYIYIYNYIYAYILGRAATISKQGPAPSAWKPTAVRTASWAKQCLREDPVGPADRNAEISKVTPRRTSRL